MTNRGSLVYLQYIECWLNMSHFFGNLGTLIRLGYIPLPEQPDRDAYALDDDEDGLNKLDYMEDMKQYRKEVAKFREDGPKLYGVILKYLSDESLDAIQKIVLMNVLKD